MLTEENEDEEEIIEPTTLEEVNDTIKKLKTRRASGNDDKPCNKEPGK